MTIEATSISSPSGMAAGKSKKEFVRLRPDERMTLAKTFAYLWADVRRKRLQMERPVNLLSMLTGFFSINIIALAIWRFSIFCRHNHLRPLSLMFYYLNVILFGFDVSPTSWVGPGFVACHMVGVIIHGKIGKNCTTYGRNTIGGKGKGDTGGWFGGPVLGDNVTMGLGGNIISDGYVGDNVTVGSGAWCFKSVEPNCIMVGMPATVLRLKTDEELRQEAKARGEIS